MIKLSVIVLLLSTVTLGDIPSFQLNLTTPETEIFEGKNFNATITITNKGITEIEIPRPERASFISHLLIDNPDLRLAGGASIIRLGQESPTVWLKPGESASHKVWLSGKSMGTTVTFKVGFKASQGSTAIWSNPVSVALKSVEALRTGTKTNFDEINLDRFCFPFTFHLKNSFFSKGKGALEDNLVIQNESKYAELLKVRRGVPGRVCDTKSSFYQKQCEFEQACLKNGLPHVNFREKTVLGQFTSGHCGTSGFKREVFRDDKAKTVSFIVEPINTVEACSGPPGESMNMIAIPKIPTDYKVNFFFKFP